MGAAIWYALGPERRRLLLFCLFSAITLMAGLLGTITGIMKSFEYAAGQEEQIKFMALGTFESLNCIWIALCMVIMAGLVSAIGVWRSGSPKGEDQSVVHASA